VKKLLMVTRDRHPWPLDDGRRRKYDALAELVELRVLGSGETRDEGRYRFERPRAFVDLALLPGRVAHELRTFRPDAVLVQGVHESTGALAARRLARSDAKLILDVQGDWHAAASEYGSRARRIAAPVANLAAPFAVRHADAVRTVSEQTSELVRSLGVEPAATFPSYVDLESFAGEPKPLPAEPRALFVGALERVKGVDVLLAAWPRSSLQVVGTGPLGGLVADSHEVEWSPSLEQAEIAAALDESWCLVLPSRSEGLPRVVLEAISRGRAVVGTHVGGIPDVIDDGVNGLLVPPGDSQALAAALERILSDRSLAERLGAAAYASAERWRTTPEEWARRIAALVH
jgi:glycosyltransferase involved in cell wall biosynthesis